MSVEEVLVSIHTFVSGLNSALALIPDVSKHIINDGKKLIAAVEEAIRLNTKGMSINQVSSDPFGVCWWKGLLVTGCFP